MLQLRSSLLIIISATILLSAAQCSAASFRLFPFDLELSDFIQNYRKTPDPNAAIDRYFATKLEEFLDQAQRTEQPHARAVLMAFYVHVIHDNPKLSVSFATRLVSEAKGERAAFGAEILAYGAGPNRKDALLVVSEGFKLPSDAVDTYMALDQFPYPQLEATDWQTLDILWASFFASGNDLYVRKIAEALVHFRPQGPDFDNRLRALSAQDPQPGTREHTELIGMLTAQSSYFGLVENARNSPDVLQVVKAIAGQNRERVSDIAKEIVEQVQQQDELDESVQ